MREREREGGREREREGGREGGRESSIISPTLSHSLDGLHPVQDQDESVPKDNQQMLSSHNVNVQQYTHSVSDLAYPSNQKETYMDTR